MILAHIGRYEPQDIRFYLDFALEVNIYYNKLLFGIYNKRNLSLICTADHTELIVLDKGIVNLNVLVDSKPEVVNSCNNFYTSKLEYNLFLVSIIEKAGYLILVKKKKMIVFDDKDNVTLELKLATW